MAGVHINMKSSYFCALVFQLHILGLNRGRGEGGEGSEIKREREGPCRKFCIPVQVMLEVKSCHRRQSKKQD